MKARSAFCFLLVAFLSGGPAQSSIPSTAHGEPILANNPQSFSGQISGNLFYVTDRVPDREKISKLTYEQAKHPTLYAGKCRAIVPCHDLPGTDLRSLEQIDFPMVSSREPGIDRVCVKVEAQALEVNANDLQSDAICRKELFDPLHKLVEHVPGKQITIFVHGFSADLNCVIDQSARLNRWLKCPVVSYIWASPRVNYPGAQRAAKRTQERFNSFLDAMESEFGAANITIIAHSMGSIIVDEALKARYYRQQATGNGSEAAKFKELDLVYADVDAAAFVQQADKITDNAEVTRLYVSNNDMIIGLSALVRGNAPRVGKPNSLLKPLTGKANLEIIDVSNLSKHSNGNNRKLNGHHLCYRLISRLHLRPELAARLAHNAYGYLMASGNGE